MFLDVKAEIVKGDDHECDEASASDDGDDVA